MRAKAFIARWGWPVLAFFAVLATIMVSLTVVTRELRDFSAAITRSDQIKTELTALSRALPLAERDGRAFVQNGGDDALEGFASGQATVGEHLRALQGIVADSPDRAQEVEKLRPVIEYRMRAVGHAVDLARAGDHDGAAAALAAIPALQLVTTLNVEDAGLGPQRAVQVRTAIMEVTAGFAILLAVITIAIFTLSEFARRGEALAAANRILGQQIGAVEQAVTERLATEQRFASFVKGVTDYAIYMLDPTGRVSSWNAGAERIKGYAAEEILGQHFSRFYTPEDAARGAPQAALASALKNGTFEAEAWRVRKDGTRFMANVVIDPLYDDNGQHMGFAKITRDVTERRKQDEALEQARNSLAQAQKMEALGQLTGGIAHDFNNMLAVILGALNIMQRRMARGETNLAPLIQSAVEGTQRGAALTQRLLAFARRQTLAPAALQINRLISGMADMVRRTLGEAIDTEVILGGGVWQAYADPQQLETALLNLVINARDAMTGRSGGRLTIETANSHLDDAYVQRHKDIAAGQYVMITVSDTGAGMPADVLAKVFDPFFTTKQTGTGLGLSQVYGFVKQSGGHIQIYSEPGKGATVRIYLPRHHGPAEEVTVSPGVDAAPRARAGESVLVVEDEDAVRALSVESLRDLGYTVLAADGAETALALLDQHPEVALLFTDVVMPNVNGRELAMEAQKRKPGLKVLYTTGYPRNAIVHAGRLDPDVRLLSKPFMIDALARAVRDVLDAPAGK